MCNDDAALRLLMFIITYIVGIAVLANVAGVTVVWWLRKRDHIK